MLIINSIDKSRLSADTFSYSGDGVAWKARVVLFMGFAAMAGGLAGGVTVLVLKYVVPGATWPALWFGVANLVANGLVMLRCVVKGFTRRVTMLMFVQLGCALGQSEHGGRLYLQFGPMNTGNAYELDCVLSQISAVLAPQSVVQVCIKPNFTSSR